MDSSLILYPEVHQRHYSAKDYHRIYYGEILAVSGTGRYHQS